MSQMNDDRCQTCGELEVNCQCARANESGHDEAKKMERDTAQAIKDANDEADEADEDEGKRRLARRERILAMTERVRAQAVNHHEKWKQNEEERQSRLYQQLEAEAMGKLKEFLADAEILFLGGTERAVEVGISVSERTFLRLRYPADQGDGMRYAWWFGQQTVTSAAQFGRLILPDVEYEGRGVCPHCFGQLGWYSEVEMRGDEIEWHPLLGCVIPGPNFDSNEVDRPARYSFYCLKCGSRDVGDGTKCIELLPQ